MVIIHDDETLEDLQLKGLRMIQKKRGFRFGEDSVLLANFAVCYFSKSREAKRTIVDLGCNCGSISLILSAKLPNAKIFGVEITEESAKIFARNIQLNCLQDRVFAIHKDWNYLKENFKPGEVDCIVSNPPYTVFNPKIKREITDLRIAREEVYSSLAQLMQISSYLLKPGGVAFYIYRANRLPEVLEEMKKNCIEPRILRFIQPYQGKAPTAFLIMGQKSGKSGGFKVEKPLILYQSLSKYSQEVKDMYGK